MKKYLNKTLILTSLICLFPVLVGALLYNKLPSEIPIHFDFRGNPDNYASKNFAVFIMPLFLVLLNIICSLGIDLDPKKKNTPAIMKNFAKWIIPIISVFIVPSTFLLAIGIKIDIVLIATLFISLIFIFIGNYLPKCKPNYTIGIKVPWTLKSEDNWNKTHRFSGFLFFFLGILMLVSSFLKINQVILFSMPLVIFCPIVYSFILYKKGI